METFNFQLQAPATSTARPNVKSFNLGDGYVEDLPVGLIQNLKSYRLRWVGLNQTDANDIITFLSNHKGYLSFLWQDPQDGRTGKYKCKSWTVNLGNGVTAIDADFNEVTY